MSDQIPYDPGAFTALGDRAVQVMKKVLTALRGALTLHDNVTRLKVTHTFGAAADTSEDVNIASLGISWVPSHCVAVETNDGAVIYPATTAHTGWTSSLVKMKSSKANTVAILEVF